MLAPFSRGCFAERRRRAGCHYLRWREEFCRGRDIGEPRVRAVLCLSDTARRGARRYVIQISPYALQFAICAICSEMMAARLPILLRRTGSAQEHMSRIMSKRQEDYMARLSPSPRQPHAFTVMRGSLPPCYDRYAEPVRREDAGTSHRIGVAQ